jgi:OOP family OmpA-OmpF porin
MQSTAALALIAPGVALAQLPGEIYLGLGAGEASYDTSGVNLDDDTDTGWKAFAGFNVNRIIGIEAGYVDLGQVAFGGPFTAGEGEVTGWNIDARVGVPVGPASVFAKAGTYYSDVQVSTPLGSVDDQSWELTYGAGAEFDFANNMGVRAEWERFELDDNAFMRDSEVDLISASLVFKFK